MKMYRYKVVYWDNDKKANLPSYGLVAAEKLEEACQKVYNYYSDNVLTINIEFDGPNDGIVEFGSNEIAEKVWRQIGEY